MTPSNMANSKNFLIFRLMANRSTSVEFRVAIIAGVVAAIVFALLVWPTLYRPLPIMAPPDGMRELVAARENRITGEVQWLPALSHTWISGGSPREAAAWR